MDTVPGLKFKNASREQLHPDLKEDFPYVCEHVKLNDYKEGRVPWHWHEEAELFYIEDGALEYNFPKGKMIFPKGHGGLVNSNLIHRTKSLDANTIQYLHIFNPSLIGGNPGSRIERKFVAPNVNAPQIEIVPLSPDIPEQLELLQILKDSFRLKSDQADYEVALRNVLSTLWVGILKIVSPALTERVTIDKADGKLKAMMIYIQEHYPEKLSVKQISSSAFISERECFRVFQNNLYISPVEYLRNYRIQKACQLLKETTEPVTSVGLSCGFWNDSYFIKTFREKMGYTPQMYRKMAE